MIGASTHRQVALRVRNKAAHAVLELLQKGLVGCAHCHDVESVQELLRSAADLVARGGPASAHPDLTLSGIPRQMLLSAITAAAYGRSHTGGADGPPRQVLY